MNDKINIFSSDKNLIKLIQREYKENIILIIISKK